MRAILACAVLLAACSAHDPCAEHAGTCIGIDVTGGATQLDGLHVEVTYPDGDGTKTLRADTSARSSKLETLPLTSAVYLDATVLGHATIVISGLALGRVVGHAESSLDLESGKHYEISTALDGPPDGGAAPCPAGALVCDDFEDDGTPTNPTWPNLASPYIILNASGGDPETDAIDLGLDNHEVYRGAYALEASQTGGGQGELTYTPSASLSTGVIGVRAYLYTGVPLAEVTSPIAISLVGGPAFFVQIGASHVGGEDRGFWQLKHLTDTIYTGLAVPSDRWLCVEEVLDFDDKSIALYATDAFLPDRNAPPIATANDVPSVPLGEIDFGLRVAPASVTQAVWLDDIVVAQGRVGCE